MPDSILQNIADQADMIVAGYAFTATENDFVNGLGIRFTGFTETINKTRRIYHV
ncbi:MAG: hypothetical protein IJV40_08310 [Oscillospiraceae bacterium]|nr:hypothetical protein [Oscillospiraceae bacterium]